MKAAAPEPCTERFMDPLHVPDRPHTGASLYNRSSYDIGAGRTFFFFLFLGLCSAQLEVDIV